MNTDYNKGNVFARTVTSTVATAVKLVSPPSPTSYIGTTLSTALDGGTETSVVVSTTPPSSLGTVGTLIIKADSGIDRTVTYTNRSGATFTIASSNFLNAASTVATAALTGSAVTEVEVASIAAGTPQTGKIRIVLDSTATVDVEYTSWDTATFTIVEHDFSEDNAAIGNAVTTLIQASAGVSVRIGNEYRVVLTGYDISSVNANSAIESAAIQTNAATPLNILLGYVQPTAVGGMWSTSNSGVHLPIGAGESLYVKNDHADMETSVTVWGFFAPHGIPLCDKYTYAP